jgi:hypothetical protein
VPTGCLRTRERLSEQVSVATANRGRKRTSTDGLSEARCAAALAIQASTWLRDEEANANASKTRRG